MWEKNEKNEKKMGGAREVGERLRESGEEVRCGLCGGELYSGDPYFALEGRRVCEACLERYARGYFAHRLRRVERPGREGL